MNDARKNMFGTALPKLREGWHWSLMGGWMAAGPGEGEYVCWEYGQIVVGAGPFPGDSAGEAPPDIVLAVILANDPQAFLRAAVALAKPQDLTQLPDRYGEVFKFLLAQTGSSEAEAIFSCHKHRVDVLLDAFPLLAQDIEEKRATIEAQRTTIEVLEDAVRRIASTPCLDEDIVEMLRAVLPADGEPTSHD